MGRPGQIRERSQSKARDNADARFWLISSWMAAVVPDSSSGSCVALSSSSSDGRASGIANGWRLCDQSG
jgi:hypothetical protein